MPQILERPAIIEFRPPVVVRPPKRFVLPELPNLFEFRQQKVCMIVSALLHALVLVLGVDAVASKVQYGTSVGRAGSIEIEMVSSIPEAAKPTPRPEPVEKIQQPLSKEDVILSQAKDPTLDSRTPEVGRLAPEPQTPSRQDSSPAAQNDSALSAPFVQGDNGAIAQPGYDSNPPPPYPYQARKNHQEGRVILQVRVNKKGQPEEVRLKESSGFPLLDTAALNAVQKWRFKPARLAGVAIETIVDVPIRFQLKNA